MGFWARSAFRQLIWWGWLPALWLLVWGLLHGLFEGYQIVQGLDQFAMAHVWSGGGYLLALLAVAFFGAALVWALPEYYERSGNPPFARRVQTIGGVCLLLASVVCLVQLWRVVWDNDKDYGRFYAQSVTFYTPDPDTSASLSRLVSGAVVDAGSGCDLLGSADVFGCVKEGPLAASGWQARVGSLNGARIALSRTSGDVQRVSLRTETLTYLNEWRGGPARWSGVLDGGGITQSLGGVTEWHGTGTPTQCTFSGEYALDRAFAGERSNSLPNLLAERFPALRWDIEDVWGYCDGSEPVVVVPMTRQVYFAERTVDTAGGVVTVRGDRGETALEYLGAVAAQQFPGPVYPASLVERQREQSSWAAGRENRSRNGFGYEPATSQAQAGNVADYLLREPGSGRLQWVTPLTLRSSTSELFVAYAVAPADEITDQVLNPLSIYVLADDDPRRVNIDNLEADARNYVAARDPGFFSSNGVLVEFTPVDGDTWRAFGERNGRVVYQLDLSASAKVEPKLVNLDPQQQDTPAEPETAACGDPVDQLSPAQLADCAKRFVDELARRQPEEKSD